MHATASDVGADGTTEFQFGEEHDLSRFKKMLLGAVTAMVLATGVAVSPASATVPTKGVNALDANVPYLAWRGEHVRLGFCPPAQNGAAELVIPETASARPGQRELGSRGLERRSGQRFRAGSGRALRPARQLPRLRLHRVHLAEGRRCLHQARGQHPGHRRRRRRRVPLREAVHRRVDGARHAGSHRRRLGSRGRLQRAADGSGFRSTCSIRTASAIRSRTTSTSSRPPSRAPSR